MKTIDVKFSGDLDIERFRRRSRCETAEIIRNPNGNQILRVVVETIGENEIRDLIAKCLRETIKTDEKPVQIAETQREQREEGNNMDILKDFTNIANSIQAVLSRVEARGEEALANMAKLEKKVNEVAERTEAAAKDKLAALEGTITERAKAQDEKISKNHDQAMTAIHTSRETLRGELLKVSEEIGKIRTTILAAGEKIKELA